jgi:hypothetical protein
MSLWVQLDLVMSTELSTTSEAEEFLRALTGAARAVAPVKAGATERVRTPYGRDVLDMRGTTGC